MRRRVSRAREWSDSEIGLAVNRKTENLHTNFVRKLNNEVAAYDVGEGGRSNKGDDIRVLEWRGLLDFWCAVLDKLPHHLFSLHEAWALDSCFLLDSHSPKHGQ